MLLSHSESLRSADIRDKLQFYIFLCLKEFQGPMLYATLLWNSMYLGLTLISQGETLKVSQGETLKIAWAEISSLS
jgi:hypothetical protein